MPAICRYVFVGVLPFLLFMAGRQPLQAQATVNMKLSLLENTIDVCGQDKGFILIFDIGPVKFSDSLIGYDLLFSFNPDKVVFHTVLDQNTLTEQLQEITKPGFSMISSGVGKIFAGNITQPAVGNKPLVAIAGNYKGRCPDTVEFKLVAFEPYEDKKLGTVENTRLTARVVDSPQRAISASSKTDSVVFDGAEAQKKIDIQITAPASAVSSGKVALINSNRNFILSEPVAKDSIVIDSIATNGDTTRIYWTAKSSNFSTGVFSVNIGAPATADTGTILVRPERTDTCVCVTRFLEDTISLKKTVSSGIIGDNATSRDEILFSSDNELWKFKAAEREIEKVEIYTLLGSRIKLLQSRSPEINISKDGFSNGVYILKLYLDNQTTSITYLLYK